ncbi:MAG TPA: hypothetical protein VFO44_06485 [Steroidobacteraceae bacterium]|nr:hypothetical protein [Steroidobacteraceae bacterium]
MPRIVGLRSSGRAVRPEELRPRSRPGALRTLLACAIPTALLSLAASALAGQDAQGAITAFVGVNVVPMDADRVLRTQTVLVENGTIVAVGRRIAIPGTARIVEGHGAYLSPGLADMHTHSDTREDLKVYLANGVTSVLNMGDASAGFIDQLRPEANAGRIPGPHVYAAFMVDGSPRYNNLFVTTPDEARAIVAIAKTNGYDFIKVYNDLPADCFQAILDAGKRLQIPVIGHGVTAVGLRRQLEEGQVMVAHTEEFLYTVFYDPDHIPEAGAPDPEKIPGVIEFVLRTKAFVTADLNTYATIAHQWGKPGASAEFLRKPEARYLAPNSRIIWARESYRTRRGSIDARLAFLARFTKAMSEAGIGLIAGTDAPNIPGLLPGFSLHDDLDALQAAGLSRYRVLAIATRSAGEFIQRSLPNAEPFGTVTTGSRADLIMTAVNPLDDLATLRKPLGVMARGKWYTASDLQALLDGVAAEYNSSTRH